MSITILDIRPVDIGGMSCRYANIVISDGINSYMLGVGGLPIAGDLQPLLDSKFDELWIAAKNIGNTPQTEEIFAIPIRTPAIYTEDVFVSSRKIKDDPDEAFNEAMLETAKKAGHPKSLDLISRSALKALGKARDEINELKSVIRELDKRLKKLEK